jgi:hypothetical protein
MPREEKQVLARCNNMKEVDTNINNVLTSVPWPIHCCSLCDGKGNREYNYKLIDSRESHDEE